MTTRSTQTDRNLDFNGQEGGVSYKELSTYKGNHYKEGFKNPDMIAERQMPNRKGNLGELKGRKAGPDTAAGPKNVESGQRSWEPKAGMNYVGNPDKINAGASRNRTGNLK